MSSNSDQSSLIESLLRSFQQRFGAQNVNLLETHISYVLLNGQYAYKIKKAVKFDFLDFSTLERRHYYCQEELRLNRRYAPNLYLGLAAIGGSAQDPQIETSGPAIEYAVKMREFRQEYLAENLLKNGEFDENHIDQLAVKLTAFHRSSQSADSRTGYGAADLIVKAARDNFPEIRSSLREPADLAELTRIEQWTETEFAAQRKTLVERKNGGFVRECHGDLHLGNLALIDGEMSFFDCIEFDENLRWIDVLNEVAFLVMDFDAHRMPDYGFRFLNAYLQETGDYAGLAVLRFYVVYRAMVRAKVALISMAQGNDGGREEAIGKCRRYIQLAQRWMQAPSAGVVLMHGLSGSGKTTVSQRLLQMGMAIRLRSDVERKRLAKLPSTAQTQSAIDADLYQRSATEATYRHLLEFTQSILKAGYMVIVDAAFLRSWQRRLFSEWATLHEVPLAILSVVAPHAVLRERVARRTQGGSDASEADIRVLEHQLNTEEPMLSDEFPSMLTYNSIHSFEDRDNEATLRALLLRFKKGVQSISAATQSI